MNSRDYNVRCVLITHTPDWREVIAPFANEQVAAKWITDHMLLLHESAVTILPFHDVKDT